MLAYSILLFVQTVVLLWTPGPATIAIMVAGMNFSLYRATVFTIGVWLGFLINLGVITAGGTLFQDPDVLGVLQIVFTVYVVYFAYRMSGIGGQARKKALADAARGAAAEGSFSFIQGFTLSLLNPKAYTVNLIMYLSFFSNVELSLATAAAFFAIVAASDFVGIYLYAFIGNLIYKRNFDHRRMLVLNLAAALLFLLVTLGALWAGAVMSLLGR